MVNKRFLSLILVIALALGSVTSLSSCMQVLGDIVQMSTERLENSLGSTLNPDANNDSTNTDTDADGSDEVTDESLEFVPDTGDSETELTASTKALLSIVSVYSSFTYGSGYTAETSVSRGSGVIYKLDRDNGDAYVITNYHVVYNSYAGLSDEITLYLYGQELHTYGIEATYVGGSFANDIAVLKVSGSEVLKNSRALPATVADSDGVAVLDEVFAVGNPEGYGIAATEGIVSVESESLTMTGADGKTAITPRVIRISAAINDGNSGGGLFNECGDLIGIVNAKRNGSNIDNIAYAIPSNVAIRLAENIIHFCDGETQLTPKKAMLNVILTAKVIGVNVDAESGKVTKVEIVEVDTVSEGSAVQGQLEVGDRINYISIDGVSKTATRIHHVVDMMLLARVGSVVTIGATRDGVDFEITVTVTADDLKDA